MSSPVIAISKVNLLARRLRNRFLKYNLNKKFYLEESHILDNANFLIRIPLFACMNENGNYLDKLLKEVITML